MRYLIFLLPHLSVPACFVLCKHTAYLQTSQHVGHAEDVAKRCLRTWLHGDSQDLSYLGAPLAIGTASSEHTLWYPQAAEQVWGRQGRSHRTHKHCGCCSQQRHGFPGDPLSWNGKQMLSRFAWRRKRLSAYSTLGINRVVGMCLQHRNLPHDRILV